MGIFFSCLEIRPRLQEHVSLTDKIARVIGLRKDQYVLLIDLFLFPKVRQINRGY